MDSVDMDTTGLENVQFGEEMRQKEFCLRPNSIILNSGSYGTVPRRVLDVQKRYLDKLESHPDDWFRRSAYQYWLDAKKAAADFVGADDEDIFFVNNATSGVNIVLRSCRFQPGDAILASSLTYGAMKNLWTDLAERILPGVQALAVEVAMPIESEDDLLQRYEDFLNNHPNVKFVLIDHITSPSAILMPVERLVSLCHKHGAMVMVDGAHAPGQLQLNLKDLNADFYTGNLHKWVYAPRGCALLYIRRDHRGWIHPPVTSWMLNERLDWQFFNQGTRDHIPFFCAKHALQFYKAVGGMDKIVSYTSSLATWARDFLAKELGLHPLAVPPTMEAPNLRMLKLPGIPAKYTGSEKDKRAAALKIQEEIYESDDVQLIFDWVDGECYLRISTQIHTTKDDVRRAVAPLKRLLSEIESSQPINSS